MSNVLCSFRFSYQRRGCVDPSPISPVDERSRTAETVGEHRASPNLLLHINDCLVGRIKNVDLGAAG